MTGGVTAGVTAPVTGSQPSSHSPARHYRCKSRKEGAFRQWVIGDAGEDDDPSFDPLLAAPVIRRLARSCPPWPLLDSDCPGAFGFSV